MPDQSRARLAAGLAAATIVAMVVLGAAGADGPIWIIQGALALATVVVAWTAGGRSPRIPLAFGALLVGAVLFAVFVVFAIMEA